MTHGKMYCRILPEHKRNFHVKRICLCYLEIVWKFTDINNNTIFYYVTATYNKALKGCPEGCKPSISQISVFGSAIKETLQEP
jgi:hypothetical protein